MKKLIEIYRIREDSSLDAINKSLGTAKSVARPQDRSRQQQHTPDTAKMQADVDSSKSIFDEDSTGGGDIMLNLTGVEAETMSLFLDWRNDLKSKLAPGMMAALNAVADKLADAGAQGAGPISQDVDNVSDSGYKGSIGTR